MKNSVSKRIAALLMAVMMMLSMFNFAFAEEQNMEEGIESISECSHSYAESGGTAATCIADGSRVFTCTLCGESYTEAIPAPGHSYAESVTPATCTTDGVKSFSCTVCGDSYTEAIPASGHSYAESVTPATCTADGVKTFSCVCGDTYTEVIPAAHSYTESVTTAATCTTDGVKTFSCVCGDSYTETIPSPGHSCDVVCTATCTEAGFDVYTCTVCGFEESIPAEALGHSYGEAVIDPAATCTTDGVKTFSCTLCGDTYTETVPAAHSYGEGVVTTPATCTTEGVLSYTCTLCGDSSKTEAIPAGHNFVDCVCTLCGTAQCIWQPDCAATEHEDGCIKGAVDKVNQLLAQLPTADSITEENFDDVKAQMDAIKAIDDAHRLAWAAYGAELEMYLWNNVLQADANYVEIYDIIANGVEMLDTGTKVAKVGETEYETLADAVAAAIAANGTVILLDNITVDSETYTIPDGYAVTLDLNGKTIAVTDNKTGNYELFYIYGAMTVSNGTITMEATNDRDWNASSSIFHNRGGVLTINSGNYIHNGGTDMAYVVDNSGNYYGDATTNINGGNLSSTYIAIRNRMEENSHGASGKAILNVSGGSISGTSRAIWAQAASTSTTAPATGKINISGGTVGLVDTPRSNGAQCMTTISGGTVAAFKGEAGELTVTNSGSITGDVTIMTDAGEVTEYTVTPSGTYTTAVAKVGDNNFATLQEAINAANGGTVTLLKDIVLPAGDSVSVTGTVTLDLNGKKVEAAEKADGTHSYPIEINAGANLTITGTGTISGRGIGNLGSLTIRGSGVTVNALDKNGGACVFANSANSSTIIEGGTFNASQGIAGNIYTNGALTITGGTFETKGNEAVNGTNPAYAIIFAGTTGSISNATVSGAHGAVAVNSGSMTINSGSYTCTGCTGSDHAVYVSAGSLTINDGTFNSDVGAYSRAVWVESGANSVEIKGGTFSGKADSVSAPSSNTKISGGSFNTKPDESLLYAGNVFKANEDGTFSPAPDESKPVKVGTEYYATLSEAAEKAPAGATIELRGDVSETRSVDIKKSLSIVGNGYTLTSSVSGANSKAITVESGANGANLSISNLTVKAPGAERGINYNTTGELTLSEVSVTSGNYAVNLPGSANGAEVTITDSYLTGLNSLNIWGSNATVDVNNTTIVSNDNTTVEDYSCVKLNNDGSTSAEGTTVTLTGCTLTYNNTAEPDKTPVASNYANNSTKTGKIIIDGSENTAGIQVANVAGYTCDSLQEAVDYVEKENSSAKIVLLRNITLTKDLTVSKDVTIDPNGCTITSNPGKISVGDGATLTVEGTYTDVQLDAFRAICADGMCVYSGSIKATKGHTGGTASCSAKAECSRCGLEYGDTLPHTEKTPANCNAQATCSVCNQPYGEFDSSKHSYTYSAKDNVITETCANGCDHKATATLERDSSVSTAYTGSEIKALKVSYSENWKGGELAITYTDNVNIGSSAKGSITKTFGTDKSATATASFEIVAITYSATPNNLRYVRGSGYPLSFSTNVPYGADNDLESLYILRANGTLVMNVPIHPSYVVLSADSKGMTVITLSAAVMNSLDALNYELVAQFEHGTARTPFRVLLPFIFPMTGDEANTLLLAAISLVALGGAAAIVIVIKKKQSHGRHSK